MKKILITILMVVSILSSMGSSQACIERGELKKEYDTVQDVYYDKRDQVYYVVSNNWVLELSDKSYNKKQVEKYAKYWEGKKIVIYYWSFDDVKSWKKVK